MVNKARIVATCPDCQSTINLPPKPELWMRVTCPECGTQLEIVEEDPSIIDFGGSWVLYILGPGNSLAGNSGACPPEPGCAHHRATR